MSRSGVLRDPAQRLVAAAASFALTAALLLIPVPAPVADAAPPDCPTPVGVEELQARLDDGETVTGTGYTVARGGTPEPFDVEVLGIIRHWFLPGRHIIVVDTDSPAIDRVGGIWYGMSGSPVFDDDGRLIGGLAWGFSWGPSKLAGLTPAGEMLDLLAYPPGATQAPGQAEDAAALRGGTLSGDLARIVRERDPAAGTEMEPLRLPVPIANPRAVEFVQERFDELGLPLLAVPSDPAAATAGAGPSAPQADPGSADFAVPQAGGNFAAALSYGDNSYYASGTTAFACGGYAVAFAHWFEAAGATVKGANDGHAITIVDDSLGGPYKLMNMTALFGLLDQDRFAGVRALLGVTPPSAPIRTELFDQDTGRSTTGKTEVVFARLFPDIAALHLWDAADATTDRWGPGTSTLAWTVTGSREGGATWSFTRDNMFASNWDIGYESIWELWELLSTLQYNEFEVVSLDDLEIHGSFEEAVRRSRLGEVRVSVDGGPFEPADHGLVVRPGSRLDLQVALSGHPDVELALQVPDDVGDDLALRVRGGGWLDDDSWMLNGDGPPAEPASFDDLLATLADRAQNNEVLAELMIGEFWWDESFGDAVVATDGPGLRDRTVIDRVVAGDVFVSLFVDRDDDTPPPFSIDAACPPGEVPVATFADVPRNLAHAPAIHCAAAWDIARGYDATRFGPHDVTSRAELATFVVRLLERTGRDVPPPRDQGFPDIATSPHRDRINQLAELGIVTGHADGTYRPYRDVTRGQMASFLVRSYEWVTGEVLPTPDDVPFGDIARSAHAEDIAKAHEAGFAAGRSSERFAPQDGVTRAEMATFLMRLLSRLVHEAQAPPPPFAQ